MTVYEVISDCIRRLGNLRTPVCDDELNSGIKSVISDMCAVLEAFDEKRKEEEAEAEQLEEVSEDV